MMDTNYIGPQQRDRKIHGLRRHLPPGFDTFRRDLLPIIAIDPGQMTGWSLMVLPKVHEGRDIFSIKFEELIASRRKWEHGQIDCLDEDLGTYSLMQIIQHWPSAAVIVEDFILRTDRRERSRNLLSPVRITAKLEHYLWRHGRKMLLQQPSMAKTTVTDDRLKLWKCYVPGMPHARDADRHVLTFVRRCYGPQGDSMRTLAWPYAYGGAKAGNGVWHNANDLIGG